MTQKFESGRRTLCDKNKVVFKRNLLQNPFIGSNWFILTIIKKKKLNFELF